MTFAELKSKLLSEKHIVGALQIECGNKVEAPGILGIYEEAGTWYVYDTNDRGVVVVLDKGTEDEMADALYRRVLKVEKRLLKKYKQIQKVPLSTFCPYRVYILSI